MKKGRDKIHTLLYYNVFDIFRSRKAVSWVITRACIGGFFATLLRGVIMAFILQNVRFFLNFFIDFQRWPTRSHCWSRLNVDGCTFDSEG